MEIDDVQSTTFRFESDGRVSGHPNGLTYHWTLTDNADGEQLVRLGNFPAARVKRLKTWQWLMCAAHAIEPNTARQLTYRLHAG